MSFFEEHGADLKELFFESAQELLQTMNEEGMRLEQSPLDQETIRSLRRTVHTLKGDSAVCGYGEISELAHAMEDVLTPEMARSGNASMAELVLSAADVFGAMLAAYRNNTALPDANSLRLSIRKIASPGAPESGARDTSSHKKGESKEDRVARFSWTEYQQRVIDNAVSQGKKILLVTVAIDDLCPMRAAAMQLVRNVLEEAGTLLAIQPEDASAKNISIVQAAVATDADIDVTLNGRALRNLHFTKTTLFQPEARIKVPISEMHEGDNSLELRAKNGRGPASLCPNMLGTDWDRVSSTGKARSRVFPAISSPGCTSSAGSGGRYCGFHPPR